MKVLLKNRNGTPDQAIEAKDAVLKLANHVGWLAFLSAVEQRKRDLMLQLTTSAPTDSGAVYERVIGEIRGLDQVGAIVEGIIRRGRKVEAELRKNMERD